MNVIEVKDLKKYFVINKRDSGMKGIFKSIIHPERIIKKAVDGINFNVGKGEIIGFIGPNGAGKSTTIKMMTGILVPTEGTVTVNGIIPYKYRKENAKRIGVVFGQRTQLWWNLPVRESFDLIRTIYRIPTEMYSKNISLFEEVLEMNELIDIPVRQLSLGQRMRVEIAASLLHNPDIIYLDEPTIGLDVVVKENIRNFISKINKETGVTIILTTHDMSDIEKLCNRIIIIDKGLIIYDGNIANIKNMFGKDRILIVDFEEEAENLRVEVGKVIKTEGTRKHILFNRDDISAIDLISDISKKFKIKDFALQETEIENIISHIYSNKSEKKIEVATI